MSFTVLLVYQRLLPVAASLAATNLDQSQVHSLTGISFFYSSPPTLPLQWSSLSPQLQTRAVCHRKPTEGESCQSCSGLGGGKKAVVW